MSWNSFGHCFRVTTWGESHGPAIGCVIDGCPPGIALTRQDIQDKLDKRRPGQSRFTTQRKEPDHVEIMSGVMESENSDDNTLITTGTPIALIIYNQDARSKDYTDIKNYFRPGHADYSYFRKYGIRDYRGGGRSSARETAMRVAAGAVAQKVLHHYLDDVYIKGALVQLGEHGINNNQWDWQEIDRNPFFCPDASVIADWEAYLDDLRKKQNSCGALIEVLACNIPAGFGSPVYAKLDSELAKAMMSINAVKSVEIGEGAGVAHLTGTENADTMEARDNKNIHFNSNNAGGILGGISSGQNIVVRFAVKPTSSINTRQQSINIHAENITIATQGRHDPCVGIRAVPIGEAMMALVLVDQLLMQRAQTGRILPYDLL